MEQEIDSADLSEFQTPHVLDIFTKVFHGSVHENKSWSISVLCF